MNTLGVNLLIECILYTLHSEESGVEDANQSSGDERLSSDARDIETSEIAKTNELETKSQPDYLLSD